MLEDAQLVSEYDKNKKLGVRCALATVVRIEGSAYRRPGARMLITEEGQLTGAISGGCLEGDALSKALLVIFDQKPNLITYDTSDDEEDVFGLGLGCNGIIDILIEPIHDNEKNNPIELLRRSLESRSKCVLVTMFTYNNRKHIDNRTILLNQKSNYLTDQSLVYHDILIDLSKESLNSECSTWSAIQIDDFEYTVFCDFIQPPIQLYVFGGGNDVQPLVIMASALGWKITVIDGRPKYATKERFHPTCQIIIGKPEQVCEDIQIDKRTAIILITHNYHYDKSVLNYLIQNPELKYIGLLGPKKKFEIMSKELMNENEHLNESNFDIVYGPCGLDIGSENAQEIAVSIIAEIQAVMQFKSGAHLRDIIGQIH